MNTPSSLTVYPIGTPRNNPGNVLPIYRSPLEPIKLSDIKLKEYVVINGTKHNLTSYNDIRNLVISGNISHHVVDPSLQVWITDSSKGNRIVTLFGKNGMIYYIKAQYDPISRTMLPAI
jgi:hypothetical protein